MLVDRLVNNRVLDQPGVGASGCQQGSITILERVMTNLDMRRN